MSFIQNFKKFFNKEDYDFDGPDVTLYNFHPQLQILLMVNGIFFNNRDSKMRLMWPAVNIALGFVGLGFETIYIVRGMLIEDYNFAAEAFAYDMVLGTVPIVYISGLWNRDKITQLLDEINKDFLTICKLDTCHKSQFLQGQLLIWRMCILWFTFCLFVSGLYVGNTIVLLLYESLFATQDEYKIRPLIFPMWLPEDDPYRTPNYEIFLILEIVLITVVLQNFCGYVYIQFHILLHHYTIMDMIIYDWEMIFDGIAEEVADMPHDDPRRVDARLTLNRRMKRIVDWHNSVFECVKTVSSIHGPPLIYQVVFSTGAICIIAFQVVVQIEEGKINVPFAVLWFAAVIQLWIPCYLGTLIRDKAFEVGNAAFTCGWHNTRLRHLLRTDICIVIQRSQQPLIIQFTGLPNLTLETFSKIMSKSYSYFNMLRQST